jgi:hypothetical protein
MDISIGDSREICCEGEAPGLHLFGKESVEARLIERKLALREEFDLMGIGIDANNFESE